MVVARMEHPKVLNLSKMGPIATVLFGALGAVSCSGASIAVQIPYATGQECLETGMLQTTYKLTSEFMGGGIQIMADLVRVTADNVFHLKLHGSLERFPCF